MAEIVGSFASSHIMMRLGGVELSATRIASGMTEIGRRIRALNPDVIVMVSNDHLFNFDLSLQVPFAVGVADSYTPFGDLNVPREPRPGHRKLAEAFVTYAANADFDIAIAEDISPDHGMSIPLLFADPERRIPVVPLYINLLMSPTPAPARCWRLGKTLRSFVNDACDVATRVVVFGTGGLSHWIGCEKVEVNESWDRAFLADMEAGRYAAWAATDGAKIETDAGNGGLEVIHWLFAASAGDAENAEIIYYEPMVEWMTGMGGVAFNVNTSAI